jgi:hypothetical protein
MELDPKKSKALKISLRILIGIIILSVGIAIGAHSGHYRNYNNNAYGRANVSQFERGNRFQRQGGRQFRMMNPQAFSANQGGQVQGSTQIQAPVVNQAKSVTASTTPAK